MTLVEFKNNRNSICNIPTNLNEKLFIFWFQNLSAIPRNIKILRCLFNYKYRISLIKMRPCLECAQICHKKKCALECSAHKYSRLVAQSTTRQCS